MDNIIVSLICFVVVFGFGIATDVFGDLLGISKEKNDIYSFISGLILALFAYILSE